MEARLAPALLLAANGLLESAQAAALAVLPEPGEWPTMNPEAFTCSISALFAVQRLDVAAEMLCARFDPGVRLELQFGGLQSHSAVVQCDTTQRGNARFVFADSVLHTDRTHNHVLNFCWIFPLFGEYLHSGHTEAGTVAISLWDVGIVSGLAFCDNQADRFLIPDCLFVSTRGYDSVRRAIRENTVPWEQRHPLALWRGSRPLDRLSGWRSLPRVRLSGVSRANSSIIDAGITAVTQVERPEEVTAELIKEGLWKAHIPVELFGRHKYQIDIDGNTNSWPGLFQKLLTGSPVLKVASPDGHRQWYYHRLEPWYN
jgi:hypothetical protein